MVFSNGRDREILFMKSSIDRFTIIVACIMLLGCVVRLIACFNTCIINNDGVLYIQQARALYHGETGGLTPFHTPFFSVTPFIIAAFHYLVGDWIFSALAVSWFFGSAALIPVFLLLRRFFDRATTGLCLLLFAVMPVFVDISCTVTREPVAVFFVALGLHFFLRHLEEGTLLAIFASGFCFLTASWSRVEILAILVACWVLLLFLSPRKHAAVAVSLVSVAILLATLTISEKLTGFGAAELFQHGSPLGEYGKLRTDLRELAFAAEYPVSKVSRFLMESRGLVWFIVLGGLFKCFAKALFYPFVLIFAAGLPRGWKLVLSDRRVFFLTASAAAGFVVLYLYELNRWTLSPRLMTFSVIIPLSFVLGCGIAAVKDFLRYRCKAGQRTSVCLLALVLVFSTFTKNTGHRECDKLVFKDMGETIAAFDGGAGPLMISASAANQRLVPFYANLHTEGAFHPGIFMNSWEFIEADTPEMFVALLRERDIGYMLWDERNWRERAFSIDELLELPGIGLIDTRYHRDTGKMVLLRISGKSFISDVFRSPVELE